MQILDYMTFNLSPLSFSDFLQFVTRAVRVIDLITNLDMHAFQTHGGLTAFIKRLEVSSSYLYTFEVADFKNIYLDYVVFN